MCGDFYLLNYLCPLLYIGWFIYLFIYLFIFCAAIWSFSTKFWLFLMLRTLSYSTEVSHFASICSDIFQYRILAGLHNINEQLSHASDQNKTLSLNEFSRGIRRDSVMPPSGPCWTSGNSLSWWKSKVTILYECVLYKPVMRKFHFELTDFISWARSAIWFHFGTFYLNWACI